MALDIGKERGPRDCVVGFPQEYGEAIFEHTLAQLGKVCTAADLAAAWSA